MVADPFSECTGSTADLMWKTADELSITAQKITGHVILSVTVCLRLNRSLFKKMVRADSL
jgi:hypothetical protein